MPGIDKITNHAKPKPTSGFVHLSCWASANARPAATRRPTMVEERLNAGMTGMSQGTIRPASVSGNTRRFPMNGPMPKIFSTGKLLIAVCLSSK